MTVTNPFEKEVTINGRFFFVELEVTAELIDESFSHEFGIEKSSSIEINSSEIIKAYNEDDQEVKDKTVLEMLKKHFDNCDFTEDFETSDFN